MCPPRRTASWRSTTKCSASDSSRKAPMGPRPGCTASQSTSRRGHQSGERRSCLTRKELFQGMEEVFEEVLGRHVELRDETTAADIEGWDSVVHVMLILASERKFDLRFESSE